MRLSAADAMFRSRHGDLDWYEHSAKSLDTPRRSMWECGNRQKRKQTVANFAKYSSLHGVHFICAADSKASKTRKIFFRLFFAFCLISAMSNVVFLAQESWSTESVYIATTSKEGWNGPVEDPYFPRHPRITFCRRPGYKVGAEDQKLLEYAFLSLGYPFVSLTPQERSFMIGINAFKMQHKGEDLPFPLDAMNASLQLMKSRYDEFKSTKLYFNLTEFIMNNSPRSDEIFVRCIALVFDLNCSEIFQPVLTSMGTCFSVLVGETVANIDSLDLETTLVFDLHAAPELDKALDVGYEIYLSDPRQKDGLSNEAGETLINGYTTIVKTTLTKTSRTALSTPWHGMYTECPRLPVDLDPWDYGDRFFKVACEKRYLEKMTTKNCNCRYATDLSSTSEKLCDPADIYDCFVNYALFDNLSGMSHTCGFPCLEYGYDNEVSLVKLGDPNISRLMFIYDGKQYALREYRKTTLSSFLSQIGGALGLYLGASIITVVEMVSFAVTWLWYTCSPNRRRKASPVIHPDHLRAKKKRYSY